MNELIRSEDEKMHVRDVALATVWRASDWVSGKVRLKFDEFMAIRSSDTRRQYYESVKFASRFDCDDDVRTFWSEYLEYLNKHL